MLQFRTAAKLPREALIKACPRIITPVCSPLPPRRMKRFLSISVLLQAVTILMTLSLAVVCGLYALDAQRKQQEAGRVPQILEISNNLFTSLQNLRTERGNVFTQLESSRPMTPEAKAQIDALRVRSARHSTRRWRNCSP